MEDITQHPQYQEARRHACQLRGFYNHLFTYAIVNVFMIALNYFTSPGHIWWYWTTFGWGIGLLFHAVRVFAMGGWLGARWEDRKIREYLSRR
jgi:hypothetical protein